MKVVIIGASFAGVAAALEVSNRYSDAEVILLEKQVTLGYIPNGLHLYWDKKIEHLNDARFTTREQLEKEGITCCLHAEVQKINIDKKVIAYDYHGKEESIAYDKLIIATGSHQLSDKIIGGSEESVLKYKWYDQAQAALSRVKESQRVAIIGGGQVGVEAADLLIRQGKKVTLIESMDYVLFKYFDKEMIHPITRKMVEAGLDVRLQKTVSSVSMEPDNTTTVVLGNETVAADAVVMSVNVRPDLDFLDNRIELNADSTIAVDCYLRTSAKDVFAVGDCIQLSGPGEDRVYIPVINNAVRTGMVAASNLIEPTTPFKGSLRTIGTKVFDHYIASTGLTEAESAFTGRRVKSHRQEVRLSSYENAETAVLKWVYDAQNHELLGAQITSTADVLEKINTLALAIQTKQTIEALQQKDYFFHPSYVNMVSATNLVPWIGERTDRDES
ncbi:FAD-dependent oxidoreductase [Alkalibacterium sp.]|nr:MAG: oxidoreductase [Alkalibacterium sp.]